MEPYFETKLGKLYHGDCLEVMKEMADNSVEVILTDPPYGIGFKYGTREKTNNPIDYFEYIKPIFIEMKRIGTECIIMAQTTKYMRYFWQWYGEDIRIYIACKNFVQLKNTFMNYAYDPWVFYFINKDIKRINKPMRNVDHIICDTARLRNKKNIERDHPTPKPVSLILSLLNNYTNKNDIICDPFFGSGTTAIACERLNRRWIGIEISKEYCDIAVKRIRREVAQYKLELT